jgi:hypothetical protein
LVRAQFEAAFGSARVSVEERLAEVSGSAWAERDAMTRSELRKQLKGGLLTTAEASAFVDTVRDRARGKIDSPFIETLLSHNPTYVAMPSQELLDGFTRSYETKGHSKAKGVSLRLTVPLSWIAAEGERPNIVQKFKSKCGHGSDEVMIQVMSLPLPDGAKLEEQDLEQMFADESLKEMVPAGAILIETRSITLEGQPAGRLDYEQSAERLDKMVFIRNETFVTACGTCLIMLSCNTAGVLTESDSLRARFATMQPTYALIANSLVLVDRYSK